MEVGAEDANTEGELEGETVVSVVGREGRSEGTIEGDEGIPLGAYVGPKVVEGRIVGGGVGVSYMELEPVHNQYEVHSKQNFVLKPLFNLRK